MRWISGIVVIVLSLGITLASAPPPRSVAKETGVSVTCRLRQGGTRFILEASLRPIGAGLILDQKGNGLSGSLSDYWKIRLERPDRDGNSAAEMWRKGESKPTVVIIKMRPKLGSSQALSLFGYDKDRHPQTLPMASCYELRIRQ